MKVLKKVLLGLGIIAGLTTITACSDNGSKSEITEIDMTEDEDEFVFSEITVDTTNAKTKFYLGDDFEYDGLKVTAVYSKEVNETTESRKEEIDTFTVDTELVDMTKVGRYIVIVNGRSGMSTLQTSYVINVLDSEKVESQVEYLAGLDLKLVANDNYEVIHNHAISIKINTELTLPVLTMRAIYFKGTEEARRLNLAPIQVTVDYSKVNVNKKGSYPISYSYTTAGVTVTSFILVVVSNPVVDIEFVSGTLEQSANVNGFDYSDWKFLLTEESGTTFEQTYDSEYFNVSGIQNTLITGDYQATISYQASDMASPVTIVKDVKVTEAVGSKITLETDFSTISDASLGSRVKLGETNYFHYILSDVTGDTKIEARTKDSLDNIEFPYRVSGKAGSSTKNCMEVYMPNAGRIVMYFASSGDAIRTLECAYQDGEIVGTAKSQGKATITKAIFDVKEAGTYYLYSQVDTLYYYGIITSYELEGAIEPTPAAITDLQYLSGTTDYVQNGSKDGLNNLKFKAFFDDNTSKIYTLADEEISLSSFNNTLVGDQTLTVTFDDGYTQKTCDLPVNVTDITLSSVEFTSGSTVQRMSMGSYDVSDFVLTVRYSNGDNKAVRFTDNDKYTLSYEVDNHTIGQKGMKITFVDKTLETKTVTVPVTLIEMASTSISLNTSTIPTTSSNAIVSNSDAGYTSNGFTITTDTNTTATDNKTFNGFSFNKRLQLYKIDGLANYISFKANGPSKLVVYAKGGGAGKSIYLTEGASSGAYNNVIYALSQSELGAYEFDITEEGTYYLVSDTNYSSIYYIGLEYDQAASTPTTASITSVSLYSPIATNNCISIKQDAEFVLNDIVFVVTYSDGCISYINASQTTYTNTEFTTATPGDTSVVFTYNDIPVNVTVTITPKD